MRAAETIVDMVRRHVREGQRIVRDQRALVAQLRRDGHPTAVAEQLLAEFEHALEIHYADLRLIEEGQRRGLRHADGSLVLTDPAPKPGHPS